MNKKNATDNTKTVEAVAPEKTEKELAAEKRKAIADALAVIQKEANSDIMLVAGQAGHLLAELDATLAKIATDVAETDKESELWKLELHPVTIIKDKKTFKWVEVSGLDRNARVQIVDNNGKAEVLVSPTNCKSMEQQAYINALVEAGKDLTKAVALRKAVAGKTFRQVFAVAQAQDKARMEKKYSKIIPPMAEAKQEAKLVKKTDKVA
jgi:hypothetical protein